jgi:5-dehydro-4-deoxyglucarate dehydratase
MTAQMSPADVKTAITGGLLSFPVTDFDEQDRFNLSRYIERLHWLGEFDAAGVFPAGGAGEFFSLDWTEYRDVTRAAIQVFGGKLPVIAAAGQGTHAAIAYAHEAQALGADAILLFPPYMTESPQHGLIQHIEAVCRSTQLGVIVYNRANGRLGHEAVIGLAQRCPNFIGFKDGAGDIESILKIQSVIGDRLLFINGMPTAEIYAQAYSAIGAQTYSSALLNFVPALAVDFHAAICEGDTDYLRLVTRQFLGPYLDLRSRVPGYAVSIVKAGAELVGRGAGPVRSPLASLTTEEMDELSRLVQVAHAIPARMPVFSATAA